MVLVAQHQTGLKVILVIEAKWLNLHYFTKADVAVWYTTRFHIRAMFISFIHKRPVTELVINCHLSFLQMTPMLIFNQR